MLIIPWRLVDADVAAAFPCSQVDNMGNPKRYIFQNEFYIGKPEIDDVNKKVTICYFHFRGPHSFREHYDTAIINLYIAPDVILTYTNGNTTKDEFYRYQRWVFTNLELDKNVTIVDGINYIYNYGDVKSDWFNWDDPESKTDIPLGKFAGMTFKQVEQYIKENVFNFKFKFAKNIDCSSDFHC